MLERTIHRQLHDVFVDIPCGLQMPCSNKDEEAKLWVERTLENHPGVTIEGFLAGPDWTDADRVHMVKVMREARFPVCAKPEDLLQFAEPVRLPECVES